MFCPSCRDEFRSGFTHCAACDVDLVDSLESAGAAPDLPPMGAASTPVVRSRSVLQAALRTGVPPMPPQPAVAFCGFLTIEEASEARARLRGEGVRSEILIREDEPQAPDAPPKDTYWLRLSPAHFKQAAAILGYDEATAAPEEEEGEMVSCSACGEDVGADETFCPHCGARFEES